MHVWQCKQVPEFQNLPVNTIESLAHVLTEKEYPAKGVVYYQGNEVEDIFFVHHGRVKVCNDLFVVRNKCASTAEVLQADQ